MEQAKKERLEAKGWKVGTVSDFLELTPEEAILIEIKLALRQNLKERYQEIETKNTDTLASIESLIQEMLAIGATPQDIGQIIAGVK